MFIKQGITFNCIVFIHISYTLQEFIAFQNSSQTLKVMDLGIKTAGWPTAYQSVFGLKDGGIPFSLLEWVGGEWRFYHVLSLIDCFFSRCKETSQSLFLKHVFVYADDFGMFVTFDHPLLKWRLKISGAKFLGLLC